MLLNYSCFRAKIAKLLTNAVLVAVFTIASLGLSTPSAFAAPQSQDIALASVSRQAMANTQNRGQGSAKTKEELDQEFQSATQSTVQGVTSGVKDAVGSAAQSAAETIDGLANPETTGSAQNLGNRAKKDLRLLKDTAEDVGSSIEAQ